MIPGDLIRSGLISLRTKLFGVLRIISAVIPLRFSVITCTCVSNTRRVIIIPVGRAVPSRVSNVTLIKTLAFGSSALIVAWPTPQSDVAISQYQVQYRKRGTISWNNVTVITVLPQTIYAILTGLSAGTEYIVKVRAVSEIGAGEWSVEQTGRTFDSEFSVSSTVSGACAPLAHVLLWVKKISSQLPMKLLCCATHAAAVFAICSDTI